MTAGLLRPGERVYHPLEAVHPQPHLAVARHVKIVHHPLRRAVCRHDQRKVDARLLCTVHQDLRSHDKGVELPRGEDRKDLHHPGTDTAVLRVRCFVARKASAQISALRTGIHVAMLFGMTF